MTEASKKGRGRKQSEETRRKLSEAARRRNQSPETRAKISSANKIARALAKERRNWKIDLSDF